jgi:hypothetical protein
MGVQMIDLYHTYPILDLLENDFYKDLKKIKNFEENNTIKELDFLAKKYYNNVSYWWIIALYNDIVDPFNVDLDIIRIPDLYEVMQLYNDYKVKEKLNENN